MMRRLLGLLLVFGLGLLAPEVRSEAQAAAPSTTATYTYDDAGVNTSDLMFAVHAAGTSGMTIGGRSPADSGGDLSMARRLFVAADTADGAAGASSAGTAAKACLDSFTADTPVTLADGTTEPIEDVKVGDKVLASDPETGETKAEPVEQLIRHSGEHAMVLVTEEAYGILERAAADGKVTPATIAKARHAAAYYCVDGGGKCKLDAGLAGLVKSDMDAALGFGALGFSAFASRASGEVGAGAEAEGGAGVAARSVTSVASVSKQAGALRASRRQPSITAVPQKQQGATGLS